MKAANSPRQGCAIGAAERVAQNYQIEGDTAYRLGRLPDRRHADHAQPGRPQNRGPSFQKQGIGAYLKCGQHTSEDGADRNQGPSHLMFIVGMRRHPVCMEANISRQRFRV